MKQYLIRILSISYFYYLDEDGQKEAHSRTILLFVVFIWALTFPFLIKIVGSSNFDSFMNLPRIARYIISGIMIFPIYFILKRKIPFQIFESFEHSKPSKIMINFIMVILTVLLILLVILQALYFDRIFDYIF
jgi:hypothetical protein